MRSVLRVFVLMLLVGCGVPQSAPVDLPHATQQIKLPEFVDDPEYGVNEDIAAPRQKLIFFRNLNAIDDCLKHDSVAVREEMLKRLGPSQPMSLRLIAATVLVLKKDEEGRKFFIAQAKVPQDLGDLYITFSYLAWLTKSLTGSEPDLSWAEDFMIEALQNRTRISLRDAVHYPHRYPLGGGGD